LWNGDLPQAEQILATDLTVNAAIVGVDGAAVQGARGVAGWVALLRKALGEPVFTQQVGPIIDGDLICGRWHLRGQYAGGMPGATAAPGSPVDFTGTDILRIEGGLLAEYWLNSDVHVMAAQLGMTA
jgi:SnoaL-like polyketide cyclase